MSSPLAKARTDPVDGRVAGNAWLRCRVERVDDVRRDAAAGGDIVSVAARPVPNGGTLLAVDGRPAAARARRPSPATATDAAAGLDPLLEFVSKLCGILGRKV